MSSAREIQRAELLLSSGKTREAAQVLRDVLAGDSRNLAANFALGMLYHQSGRNDLAIPLLKKAAQAGPDVFDAVFSLGIVERLQGMLDDALTHSEKAAALQPDNAMAYGALGDLHLARDDVDAATDAFRRALDLEPDSPRTNTEMGIIYGIRGEPDQAAKHYRHVIADNLLGGDAHYRLAFNQKFEQHNDDVARMEQAFNSTDISDEDRMLVGFALGKAFDDLARYDEAFDCFRVANDFQRQSLSFSIVEQKAMFDRHRTALDKKFIEHCKQFPVVDDTPILILGMPRSGTSLVEQILASHPSVHGAGEVEYSRMIAEEVQKLSGRPFPENIDTIAAEKLHDLALAYVKNLKSTAGSAQRVTDKLPHNFLRVGLYAALLPNAKIILCNRDPLDNCVSIYQHRFSDYHGYACDLHELGNYYRLYEDMMSFWQKLLPGRLYVVSYENLVADTESQVRDLLAHCELPFHDNCLMFHKTRRLISTPSAPQVREPIYKSAIGRAQKYEQHLQPLIRALS